MSSSIHFSKAVYRVKKTGTVVERMQAGHECAAMNDLLKELRNQRAYTIQNDLVNVDRMLKVLSSSLQMFDFY